MDDDKCRTIKLSHDCVSAYAIKDKDYSESYPNTKFLQMSFNELLLQHSDPAALMCQVNSLNSQNKDLTQFEVLQFTMPFIEMLPKISQKQREI